MKAKTQDPDTYLGKLSSQLDRMYQKKRGKWYNAHEFAVYELIVKFADGTAKTIKLGGNQ